LSRHKSWNGCIQTSHPLIAPCTPANALASQTQPKALLAAEARRQAAVATAAALGQQIAEKRARDAASAREVTANKIAPDYFTQFGSSHR